MRPCVTGLRVKPPSLRRTAQSCLDAGLAVCVHPSRAFHSSAVSLTTSRPSATSLLASLRQRKTAMTFADAAADAAPASSSSLSDTTLSASDPFSDNTFVDPARRYPEVQDVESDLFGPSSLPGVRPTKVHLTGSATAVDDVDVNATLLSENAELLAHRVNDDDDDDEEEEEDGQAAELARPSASALGSSAAGTTARVRAATVDEEEELAVAVAELATLRAAHEGLRPAEDEGTNRTATDEEEEAAEDAEEVETLIQALLAMRQRGLRAAAPTPTPTGGSDPSLTRQLLTEDINSWSFFTRQELQEMLAHAQQTVEWPSAPSPRTSKDDPAAHAFDTATARSAEMESVGDELTSRART